MKRWLAVLTLVSLGGALPAQIVPTVVDALRVSIDRIGTQDVSGPGSIIRKVLDTLANKKNLHPDTTLVVVFGSFTYGQTGLGSPFGRFLEDQFSAALVKSRYFSLFPRELLANLPPRTDAGLRDQLGGARATGSLSGKFSLRPDGSVAVDYQLADLDRGLVIGYDQVVIPKSSLPAGLALEPPAPPAALPPVPAAPAGLSVALTSDRGEAGAYFDGEELLLTVYSSRAGWLKVYQMDGSGALKLIFPNAYSQDNQIPAAQALRIPAPGSPFAFKLGPPYGVETIRAVVSTVPFQTAETPFQALPGTTGSILSRGLSVEPKAGSGPPELAQAQISYTVSPSPR